VKRAFFNSFLKTFNCCLRGDFTGNRKALAIDAGKEISKRAMERYIVYYLVISKLREL
jgi:hypothetical protein